MSCANKRLQMEDFPHPLPPMIARFFLEPIGRFDVSRAKGECASLEMVSSPSDDVIEDDDDLSNLIDNDEDAFETDNYDSIKSPSPRMVNYLTNIETQSSYFRRQRLTAASTLDLPVRGISLSKIKILPFSARNR